MSTPTDEIISPVLLALLVCPKDHGELSLETEHLTCTVCGTVYPIENGIPNMIVEAE
ncbi:hypothetical protein BH23CHL5_BH23CHL5_23040 [soil metagenome]